MGRGCVGSTDRDHWKIIQIYNEITLQAGQYAPYLSKGYFIENTIHECISQGIKEVSKTTVYRALQREQELSKIKKFLEDDND